MDLKRLKHDLALVLFVVFGIIAIGSLIREKNAKKIIELIVLVDEKASPLDTLPIEKHEIKMRNRVLYANLLKVSHEAPSVFICTGNGEALYEWLDVQKYFMDHGYTSYIFSYTGFGNSTGTPTRKSLFEDAAAAYEQYVGLTPNSTQRICLAHSMGNTPLHAIVHKVDPSPDKVIFHAPFYSITQLLVEREMADASTRWLWPDIFNSLNDAEKIEIPALYVHSRNDQSVSYTHSEMLYEAMGDNATLLLLDDFGHNAIYKNVSDSFYLPLLKFIEQ